MSGRNRRKRKEKSKPEGVVKPSFKVSVCSKVFKHIGSAIQLWNMMMMMKHFLFLEEHPGEEPAEEFQIHQREEQKRQSRPVIAAAALYM